ncbi:hypothetical protein BDV93DRAFT_494878 [Ceratobasidium sp. AG-I]|nr:hypothetical protein BDV93DRAFT_494878 [Ceratobasidium sp. AG-I]
MSDPDVTSPKSTFELIFHGTGCSSSIPNITCVTSKPVQCETCAASFVSEGWKNKRRNTGGIVRLTTKIPNSEAVKETVVVIDTGKTFLAAALDLFPRYGLRRIDAVLLTHGHADAMNGLDDLRGWTLGKNRIQDYIDVYLSESTLKDVRRSFPYLVSKEHATGSGNVAEFRWHVFEDNKPFHIDGTDIDITPIAVHHGQLSPLKKTTAAEENQLVSVPEPYFCSAFIFGDIMVYMSDVSFIPPEAWQTIEASRGEGARGYQIFVVDCLRMEAIVSHFGMKEVVESAKRINAKRTYVVGFGHEIPHDGWDKIARVIGGEDEGEVRTLVRKALDKLPTLGVGIEKGLWVRPAYDGQRVVVEGGKVWDDKAPV